MIIPVVLSTSGRTVEESSTTSVVVVSLPDTSLSPGDDPDPQDPPRTEVGRVRNLSRQDRGRKERGDRKEGQTGDWNLWLLGLRSTY